MEQSKSLSRFFLKYPSIANARRSSDPDLSKLDKSRLSVAQEKYDGSNIQFVFVKCCSACGEDITHCDLVAKTNPNEKDCTTRNIVVKRYICSRNLFLGEHTAFQDVDRLLVKQDVAAYMKRVEDFLFSSTHLSRIHLYGEIYGRVSNRVNYYLDNESDKHLNKLIFFDCLFVKLTEEAGDFLTFKEFLEWAKLVEIPTCRIVHQGTLEECLNLDLSNEKSSGGSLIEGVVIKPVDSRQGEYYKRVLDTFRQTPITKADYGDDLENIKPMVFDKNRMINALGHHEWKFDRDLKTFVTYVVMDSFKDYYQQLYNTEIEFGMERESSSSTEVKYKFVNVDKAFESDFFKQVCKKHMSPLFTIVRTHLKCQK